MEPEPVLSDPVLRAVSLFGARIRGHGSDHDTPEVHAWLIDQAAADAGTPPPDEPSWRTRARSVDRRLPPPARRAVRALIGRLRA